MYDIKRCEDCTTSNRIPVVSLYLGGERGRVLPAFIFDSDPSSNLLFANSNLIYVFSELARSLSHMRESRRSSCKDVDAVLPCKTNISSKRFGCHLLDPKSSNLEIKSEGRSNFVHRAIVFTTSKMCDRKRDGTFEAGVNSRALMC